MDSERIAKNMVGGKYNANKKDGHQKFEEDCCLWLSGQFGFSDESAKLLFAFASEDARQYGQLCVFRKLKILAERTAQIVNNEKLF